MTWFRGLLLWKQIVVILVVVGSVGLVADAASSPLHGDDSTPVPGGTFSDLPVDEDGPSPTRAEPNAVAPSHTGRWVGWFRLMRLVTGEGEWEPLLVFYLTVETDGSAEVFGHADTESSGTWGSGHVAASFSCTGIVSAGRTFECTGPIHVETAWEFTRVGRHPLLGSVWQPAMIGRDHGFSENIDSEISMSITLSDDLQLEGVVTGPLTGGRSTPEIEGNWFGPLGTDDPIQQ